MPKIQKIESPQPTTSEPSTSQVKSNAGFDMKALFKERAAMFKAKDQTTMQAPPSAPPKPQQPKQSSMSELLRNSQSQPSEKGKMAEKLKNAAPYNFFLAKVVNSPRTYTDPLSIGFQELFDPSLGDLESTVQFNCIVDINWLMDEYSLARIDCLPLLILFGQDREGLESINKSIPNVTAIKVNVPFQYGVHHTKMMFLLYKDKSMRVVVSTANLYREGWHNRVQGIWISDKLPELVDGKSGDSVTEFRAELLKYLATYNIQQLQPYIARIRKTDFSSINVFFVASVPGNHENSLDISYGHRKVGQLLSQHSASISPSCPIIAQASALGNYGGQPYFYLLGEIVQSFRRDSAPPAVKKQPTLKLIFPSLKNVLESYDGLMGADCLVYFNSMNATQPWLKQYLYQWRCESRDGNQAIPHIKTYCRYNDQGLYWFLLTSANMSKSAMGSLNKGKSILKINSYEAGVLFCPRIIIEKDQFPMNETQQRDGEKIFKLPFDIPPVPYNENDIPFTTDQLQQLFRN